MADIQPLTAEGRYDSLDVNRSPFLARAREAALLTIPGLMPPEGSTGSNTFHTPFQSVGARGVNNLAAKMLLALFPPGSPFFRLTMDEFVLTQLMEAAGEGAGKAKVEFEAALAKVERAVLTRMDQMGARLPLFEALKQLLVAGNCLIQILPKGKLVLHRLNNYVVKRDPSGAVMEIVVRQTLSRMTLPERAREIVESKTDPEQDKDKPGDNSVNLYTRISRKNRGTAQYWAVHQEIMGERIPDTEGTYPLDKSPWLPLRYTQVDGEDYGRGFVEEYMGDLRSLESLSQSIVEFAAVASKILFLVNEAGVTSKKKLATAPSGAIVDGDIKDISILQLDKFADFQVSKATADGIEKRLEQSFLLNSSIQRDAERVTAEEIRFLASELEQAHGGVYALQAQELQYPLVVRYMSMMQREGKLPSLPDNTVKPQIVTGLEALGRSADLQKLDILVSGIAASFGAEAVSKHINVGEYVRRRAIALGFDAGEIVRSPEEVAQSEANAAEQELTAKLGPTAMKMSAEGMASSPPSP